MQEVAALCDELIVIAAGTVIVQATPDELKVRAGTPSLEEAFVRLAGLEGAGAPA
jgi:sodium transport system ATP-binding protein